MDLSKAYNSINYSFIRQVMGGLSFHSRFIGWVMEYITSPSYSIVVNGALCKFFKGAKGLRQGDPISPFIFVLYMEYLSRALNCVARQPNFNIHPKCNKLNISHLIFADDIMLMSRGDPISVSMLMCCLNDFAVISSSSANLRKSNAFTAGIQGGDMQDILSITGF